MTKRNVERLDLFCAFAFIVIIGWVLWTKVQWGAPDRYYVVGTFNGEVGLTIGPIRTWELCVDLAEEYQLDIQKGKETIALIDEEERTEIQKETLAMDIQTKCGVFKDRPFVKHAE